MNKILLSAIIAGGLLLLDSPEAAADHKARNYHRAPVYDHYRSHRDRRHYYRSDNRSYYARPSRVPYYLRHDRSFHNWYSHSRLRRDRFLPWHRLYDIYRRQHSHHSYRRH